MAAKVAVKVSKKDLEINGYIVLVNGELADDFQETYASVQEAKDDIEDAAERESFSEGDSIEIFPIGKSVATARTGGVIWD